MRVPSGLQHGSRPFSAIFVRPVLATLTVIGIVINRLTPDTLQRARLDVIDRPLRLIPPLPDTDVTRVALPHCPAEWVVAPQARGSQSLVLYFHGSALVTLGLNSHRRFVSRLSAATGAQAAGAFGSASSRARRKMRRGALRMNVFHRTGPGRSLTSWP